MKESNIQKTILERLSKLGSRLFRINVGRAWTGNDIVKFPMSHPKYPGAILIKDPRPFKTGVPKGYSDISGWTPVVITLEMVGKTLAVFTVVEVKTPTGRLSTDQKRFLGLVDNAGGISFMARSADEAEELILNAAKKHQRKVQKK